MPIDYDQARGLLLETFAKAEGDLLSNRVPAVPEEIRLHSEVLFQSGTQAFREVLLGCVIARIQDKNINIRQPYVELGENAFSGRSLDERVVNPLLQDKRIPSSRGPYLSVFRRSVQFDPSIRPGLRDKSAYDAFLSLISYLETECRDSKLRQILRYLLYKFAELREISSIPLSRLQRISLEQYDALFSALLATPSGGRLPVLLFAATLTAIKEFFSLDCDINWQGINVADSATGAGGDITITKGGQIIMAAEVTERPLDRARVRTTFNTKIAPAGIEDYLFFVKPSAPTAGARQEARQYFAQGHEVNFLDTKEWILMVLATLGKRGRGIFNRVLINLLDAPDVPRTLKVSWNEQIASIVTTQD